MSDNKDKTRPLAIPSTAACVASMQIGSQLAQLDQLDQLEGLTS